MNFEDITARTKIVISVTNGTDLQAKFMSKVVKNTGKFLMVIPFRYKGQRINFNGKNMRIHLEVRDHEGILWNFKNCHISTVKKDGLVYHKLECSMMNGIENRRGGRRFYIWEQAMFNVEGLENPLFTYLKDIGGDGFAFVLDHKKQLEIREGKKVVCTTKDREGKEMIMRGMIVRKEWLDKYTVFGCRIEEKTDQIDNHIKWLERKNTVIDVDY